jgi:hypothetical protein
MNKEDYLRKKGLLPKEDLGLMYFAYFNKDTNKVAKFAIQIWEKYNFNYWSFKAGTGNKTFQHTGTRYKFQESPYEIDFFEGENYGHSEGMASGTGDLLRWCYYGYLDPKEQDKKYEELLIEQRSWVKQIFEKIDVRIELPDENWRGFVFTDASGIEFKRIATYLKDVNVWADGNFYQEEFVTHWLKEVKEFVPPQG